MAVKVEELVERGKGVEEVEEELAGIKNLKWDFLGFERNLEIIERKLETSFVHIREALRNIETSKEERKNIEALLEKSKEDFSGIPHFHLYENAKKEIELMDNIISILALQLDVLSDVNQKLKDLLMESKRYGVLAQKTQTELDSLREIVNSFKTFMEETRKHLFEVTDRFTTIQTKTYSDIYNALAEIKSQRVDLSPLLKRIEELEKRISELEGGEEGEIEMKKMEEKKEEIKPTPTSSPIKSSPAPSPPLTAQEIKEKMRKLMMEGITDREELSKRIGIKPEILNALGYKRILREVTGK
jgi:uncharacterized coiled-coil protein SlyX